MEQSLVLVCSSSWSVYISGSDTVDGLCMYIICFLLLAHQKENLISTSAPAEDHGVNCRLEVLMEVRVFLLVQKHHANN